MVKTADSTIAVGENVGRGFRGSRGWRVHPLNAMVTLSGAGRPHCFAPEIFSLNITDMIH